MKTTSVEDPMQRLPHDVLGEVLRRFETTPRILAAARCVCKAWRAVVDDHGLLRADLLPLSVSGIFTHPADGTLPDYFALPHQQPSSSTQTPAAAAFESPDTDPLMVMQHCNGLLLLGNYGERWRVLNPATRQWTCLPSPPPLRLIMDKDDHHGGLLDDQDGFLVFDPTTAPHYQVLLINSVSFLPDSHIMTPSSEAREWPPSPYPLRVFSSDTRLWETKQFTRSQGEARGTVGDMVECPSPDHCYAAYWRGALYVHQRDFVMRMDLSHHTYRVARLPKRDSESDADWYLGKSNGGVYCALFNGGHGGCFGLQVWFLDETSSCGQMKWDLRRDVDLQPLLEGLALDHGDDDGPSPTERAQHGMSNGIPTLSILGFHPNEEVVFVHTPSKRVMAYRFSSSEAQDLGYLPMDEVRRHRIHTSFPYTPCRVGELSSNLCS